MPATNRRVFEYAPDNLVVYRVNKEGENDSFSVDATADDAQVFVNSGSKPTLSLGSASDGLKTCTLTGGANGNMIVVVRHKGRIGGFQPPAA